MPEPTPNESEKAFTVRCMEDKEMLEKFPESDQRYAVCLKYYEAQEQKADPDYNVTVRDDRLERGYLGTANDFQQASAHTDTNIHSDIAEEYEAAEYDGKKVTLNKPFRTKGGPKKFAVYVKNEKGNVVIVRFGDPNMEIKRDDPKRRKAFRDRHNCATPGPKWKARYWSCRMWSKTPVNELANIQTSSDFIKADMSSCTCELQAVEFEPCASCKTPAECKEAGECLKPDWEGSAKITDCARIKEASCACPPGQEMIAGECVDVSIELTIDAIEASVCANTGRTVIRMAGVAFTEGYNKNNWRITREAASLLTHQMVGADLTLNHPKAHGHGFTRNMDGGVDEATVGIVHEASLVDQADTWVVKFRADVYREELFASLESGLWLRDGYGVSIGGSGVPSEIIEASEDSPMRMTFDASSDFTFDHLAIVHNPAYPGAIIESVERVQLEEQPQAIESATLISHSIDESVQQTQVEATTMTEEIQEVEASAEDSLREELVLANARITEFEAQQQAIQEESRLALVEKASSLGLSGVEEFSTEMLERVISSWEESQPEPRVLEEATPAAPEAVIEASEAPEVSQAVVSNYLNGELVESPEAFYEKAWNAWAAAWNGGNFDEGTRAPTYQQTKEMI
jgi:hypothetical protein